MSNQIDLQSALDEKSPADNPTFTGNVTVPEPTMATDAASKDYVDSSTGGDVEWGNITGNLENQEDLIQELNSKADQEDTQNALDLKAPLANPIFTGNVTVPAPFMNTDAATKEYVDNSGGGGSVSGFPLFTAKVDVAGSGDSVYTTLQASLDAGHKYILIESDLTINSDVNYPARS